MRLSLLPRELRLASLDSPVQNMWWIYWVQTWKRAYLVSRWSRSQESYVITAQRYIRQFLYVEHGKSTTLQWISTLLYRGRNKSNESQPDRDFSWQKNWPSRLLGSKLRQSQHSNILSLQTDHRQPSLYLNFPQSGHPWIDNRHQQDSNRPISSEITMGQTLGRRWIYR